ncbi:MAG: SET domain-containing protein-lysine N-methyltransferase [Patescibacteria group bacterium]
MFLVKTKLGPSKIHGIGVFAVQDIPKGTLVQKFIDGVDLEITPEIVNILPTLIKQNLLHYAYQHKITGNFILNSDDARFLNSSQNPNLIGDNTHKEADIAAKIL